MSYDKLVELDDALKDINRPDVMEKLMEKLDRYELSFLSSIIHVCKLEGDTLGTYTRGSSSTSMRTMKYGDDFNDIRGYWERADLLDVVNKAYKYYVVNNGVYVSLVVRKWPVICIRPGYILANNLATFAHEVEHFVGDEEKEIDLRDYENEDDYVQKTYYRPGGEFDAYQAGAMLYHNLFEEVGYSTNQSYMKYFDFEGIIIDPIGLEEMVLNEMEYGVTYRSDYRSEIVDSFNEKSSDINTLREWYGIYEENLDISNNNVGIYEGNIGVYERNTGIYERRGDQAKVEEMQQKLADTKIKLENEREAVIFYQNIIDLKTSTLDEAQRELNFVQDLFFKMRGSQISIQN